MSAADTFIADATNDKRELQVGMSSIVTDCLHLSIVDKDGGRQGTLLNKASAKVLFARLGAFLHDWSIPDDDG